MMVVLEELLVQKPYIMDVACFSMDNQCKF